MDFGGEVLEPKPKTKGTKHLIIVGDSSRMPEIPDGFVDLIVTSPPYYDVKNYSQTKECIGEKDDYQQYLQSLFLVFKECWRVLKPTGFICVNVSNVRKDQQLVTVASDVCRVLEKRFILIDDIIWKKPDGYASRRWMVTANHPHPLLYYPNNVCEHIYILRKSRERRKIPREVLNENVLNERWLRGVQSDVWQFNTEGCSFHPAPFPEKLPARCIKLYSLKNDCVLDPFLSSGTVMKIARDLGRNSVGIELNSEYLPKIKERVGFGQQGLEGKNEYYVIDREHYGYH